MKTAEQDYGSLSRLRKLAIFFTIIGPENAAEILRSFEDAEVEAIVREMVDLDLVDDQLQQRVLDEFSTLLLESATSIKGGYDIAFKTMENARGVGRARSLASKLGLLRDAPTEFGDFSEMSARQMWNLIKTEQLQTIAFLLSAIEADKAAEIIELMDESMQTDVVVAMGQIGPTSSKILHKVLKNLSRHTEGRVPPTLSSLGGAERLAAVMKRLNTAVGKSLLASIESTDAVLGAKVLKEMFSFRDLVRLNQEAMQRIMREVDTPTMVMAMKSAPAELANLIYGSLSKRGAEALREELEMMGPVRIKEVEAAQEIVLQVVRKLEEEGEISLDGDGEDQYV
ncbi:MAG: flagellar motor switch protein FliG [Verrucomicrobiae bacterium]|nr:flagellar motor switch protein FliG [Verrucomicrobiae bacterium]